MSLKRILLFLSLICYNLTYATTFLNLGPLLETSSEEKNAESTPILKIRGTGAQLGIENMARTYKYLNFASELNFARATVNTKATNDNRLTFDTNQADLSIVEAKFAPIIFVDYLFYIPWGGAISFGNEKLLDVVDFPLGVGPIVGIRRLDYNYASADNNVFYGAYFKFGIEFLKWNAPARIMMDYSWRKMGKIQENDYNKVTNGALSVLISFPLSSK